MMHRAFALAATLMFGAATSPDVSNYLYAATPFVATRAVAAGSVPGQPEIVQVNARAAGIATPSLPRRNSTCWSIAPGRASMNFRLLHDVETRPREGGLAQARAEHQCTNHKEE
jgi:hypothetical protein